MLSPTNSDSMEEYAEAIYAGMERYGRMKKDEDRGKLRKNITEAMSQYNGMAKHKVFNTTNWFLIYNESTKKK